MTETHRWYAVRCCCEPGKILGFLRLMHKETTFWVEDYETGKKEKIEIQPMHESNFSYCPPYKAGEVLPDFRPYKEELAVHSNDRPIEFWRRVKGFMEIKDGA